MIYKVILVAILSLGILSACEKKESTEESSKTSNNVPSQPQEDYNLHTPHLSVGDSVKMGGDIVFRVKEIKDDVTTEKSNTPRNDKLIKVRLSVENRGLNDVSISHKKMKMVDPEYNEQDQLEMNQKNMDRTLKKGDKFEGELVFDVVNSDSYEFIVYDPIVTGEAKWKFTSEEISK